MNGPSRLVRILALVQLSLVLPTMVCGSICMSSDGSERLELGYCECAMPVVGTADAVIGVPGTPECGPCRDEAFSAVRMSRPSADYAPASAASSSTSCVVVLASPIAEARVFWTGEPTGFRLPILRC